MNVEAHVVERNRGVDAVQLADLVYLVQGSIRSEGQLLSKDWVIEEVDRGKTRREDVDHTHCYQSGFDPILRVVGSKWTDCLSMWKENKFN
jgi:hypothetical protein